MVKYCPECGARVKETDRYCSNCGAAIHRRKKFGKKQKPESVGKTWPKNTRIICGITTLVVTVFAISFVLYVGHTVGTFLKEHPEMYSMEGSPIGINCTTDADCICEENSTSVWCSPAFVVWKCEEGKCTPIRSEEAYFEQIYKQNKTK